MRPVRWFGLILIGAALAGFLAAGQREGPGGTALTYEQVVEALSEAGLPPTVRTAAGGSADTWDIPAREFHQFEAGEAEVNLWVLHEGDFIRGSGDRLTLVRKDGSNLSIPAEAVSSPGVQLSLIHI